MKRVTAKGAVKKTRDEALEHVRNALREGGNPLTKQEMSFICTSCHILGIDSSNMMKAIVKEAREKGKKQPRKVMEHLQAQLRGLAKHKRPTPNPAASTRAGDVVGAPARSLGNLLGCAEALKEATRGQYSKGIKAAMKAMEDAKADFKSTIDRAAEAGRWKQEMIEDWVDRGKKACTDLTEKAEEALREAEKREEAEEKIRKMEGQCEELAGLAAQAGKQIPAEAKVEVLEELEEEIDQRKEMVGDIGRALRGTIPEELKDRMEEAVKESLVMATKGRRYVDHVRTRLDFSSKDSMSSSSKVAVGAIPWVGQTAAEELGEVFEDEDMSEDEAGEADGVASGDLLEFMRGLGHMRANDSGWPVFDGRYSSYPRFRKEWKAYRETYHSAVNDNLAARTLRDRCLKGDALQVVSHLDDLQEMWETLDTCYERPEKYMEEALRPIVDFRRYKIADSAAVREFYSLLRAAIKGARGIGRLGLLINDQTIPRIMSKMPYTDWKEWATKRPNWMQQDLATTFESFIEKKWQDALNVAAAEPTPCGAGREKPAPSGEVQDGVMTARKGTLRITGVVNVVGRDSLPRPYSPPWDVSFGRRCRAQNLIECDGDHVMLQCSKLLSMKLNERKEILEKSGLCLFCLKHAANLECYGRGGLSKPRCTQGGCNGEHTPGVHRLMKDDNASVNVVAEVESVVEDEVEDDDEDGR
jgi:hypothetical protein